MDKKPPLLFMLHNNSIPRRNHIDAKTIASHVSARYNPWRKTNRESLALDPTTKAIMTPQQPPNDDAVGAALGGDGAPLACAAAAPTATNTLIIHPMRTASTQAETAILTSSRLEEPQYRHIAAVRGNKRYVLPDDEPASDDKCQNLFTSWQGRHDPNHNRHPLHIPPHCSSLLDPFIPTRTNLDHEINSNLHFYLKVIRPHALHLISGWDWVHDLTFIQASPALTYAIAAYASLFVSAIMRGGPGVVLPPPVKNADAPLWPIPIWFQLQTRCLVELNPLLADPQRVNEHCFQAILFLFRIAILLADGATVRMHYQALKHLPTLIGRDEPLLEKDMAVAKVNIVETFLRNSSIIMIQEKESTSNSRVKLMVDVDKSFWPSDRDWHRYQARLAGRLLTLRADGPADHLQKDSANAIARVDPQIIFLDVSQSIELQYCYQIALYFSVHLNAINYNTEAPEIRTALQRLQLKLEHMDLESVSKSCRSTMFHILLNGAMASRCQPERMWFVGALSDFFPEVQSMRDMVDRLDEVTDASAFVMVAVDEIWDDVLTLRRAKSRAAGRVNGRRSDPKRRKRRATSDEINQLQEQEHGGRPEKGRQPACPKRIRSSI